MCAVKQESGAMARREPQDFVCNTLLKIRKILDNFRKTHMLHIM
jgi:hypothetical protein